MQSAMEIDTLKRKASATISSNEPVNGEPPSKKCHKSIMGQYPSKSFPLPDNGPLTVAIQTDNKAYTMSKAFIGKPAPEFTADAVVDGDFTSISLSQYKGKYVVLFFYPLDFTFVCPTEIIAFSDRVGEFKKLGVEVLAASTDSKFSHLAWTQTPRKHGGLGDMQIPLLADTNHKLAREYGVLKDDEGIAYRGLFIIDKAGTLRQITINDLPVGRSVDETLRLVQAFQFVDEHGEVCPANWTPGKDTINPKKANEYFTKQ